jgi:hypothetical protein
LAELTQIIAMAGFDNIRTGEPVDVLRGAKGEPPARQFDPFGIAIAATRKAH